MTRVLWAFLLLLALPPGLCGGEPLRPVEGALPAGTRIVEVGSLHGEGPMALDPSGSRLAFSDGGLRILDLTSGRRVAAGPQRPLQLAWSADGQRLAVACDGGGKCLLQWLGPGGGVQKSTQVPGRVSGLQWRSDGSLLAMAFEVERFRFGTQLVQTLYRWDGASDPVATRLNGSTMMPEVAARLAPSLPRLLGFALSPLEDEILYFRIYNPPALASRLRLELYHLELGRERTLAEVAFTVEGTAFTGAGDGILYGDGTSASQLVDPWGGRTLATFPVPGNRVALSGSGRFAALDGRLFQEGRLLATFPPGTRILFPRQPGLCILVAGGRVFRLTGLPDRPAILPSDAERARLRQLRRWLADGLITAEDYAQRSGRGTP